MQVEIIHLDWWGYFLGIAILLMFFFRLVVYRYPFEGRGLISFSAGLALFFLLCWLRFDELITVPAMEGETAFDRHFLNNTETTIRYYYWYTPTMAMAWGSMMNFVWLLGEKKRRGMVSKRMQGRIFYLSFVTCISLMMLAIYLVID